VARAVLERTELVGESDTSLVTSLSQINTHYDHHHDSHPSGLDYYSPTGVGKRPRGLLVLRGEDFSDPRGNVTQYVNVIKGTLYQHLLKCNGHGVVLFDEVRSVCQV